MKNKLYGHGRKCGKGYTGKPSEKQLNIIKKLRMYYGNEIPKEVKTFKEAWDLIAKYSDNIRYDRSLNEFYIEGHVVGYTQTTEKELEDEGYKLMTDEELEKTVLGEVEIEEDYDDPYNPYDVYDPGDDFETDWINSLE